MANASKHALVGLCVLAESEGANGVLGGGQKLFWRSNRCTGVKIKTGKLVLAGFAIV
jgi:hypothetical protein